MIGIFESSSRSSGKFNSVAGVLLPRRTQDSLHLMAGRFLNGIDGQLGAGEIVGDVGGVVVIAARLLAILRCPHPFKAETNFL